MLVRPFNILIFGNLFFFILAKQIALVSTQNIYVPASLCLNIALLLGITRISKIPKLYGFFFVASLIGIGSSYLVLDVKDFIAICVKYSWILTSAFLINHLVKHTSFEVLFAELSRFAIFTGYLILISVVFSLVIINDAYVVNEGIQNFLISSSMSKKFALLVLPFFFLGNSRHLPYGVLLLIYMFLGNRALMLSALCVALFVLVRFLRQSKASLGQQKLLKVVFVCVFVISVSFLAISQRTVGLANPLSSIDRVVGWAQYVKVILDYPLGLGPEGGFYFLKKYPSRQGLQLSAFSEYLVDREISTGTLTSIDDLIEKRVRIHTDLDAKSSENLYIDFVASYGIIGIVLLLHLMYKFVWNFRYALAFSDLRFSTIYASFGGLLVYGLFNSFHSGMFFLLLMYISLFAARKS
jgi:hypothetical protein